MLIFQNISKRLGINGILNIAQGVGASPKKLPKAFCQAVSCVVENEEEECADFAAVLAADRRVLAQEAEDLQRAALAAARHTATAEARRVSA